MSISAVLIKLEQKKKRTNALFLSCLFTCTFSFKAASSKIIKDPFNKKPAFFFSYGPLLLLLNYLETVLPRLLLSKKQPRNCPTNTTKPIDTNYLQPNCLGLGILRAGWDMKPNIEHLILSVNAKAASTDILLKFWSVCLLWSWLMFPLPVWSDIAVKTYHVFYQDLS